MPPLTLTWCQRFGVQNHEIQIRATENRPFYGAFLIATNFWPSVCILLHFGLEVGPLAETLSYDDSLVFFKSKTFSIFSKKQRSGRSKDKSFPTSLLIWFKLSPTWSKEYKGNLLNGYGSDLKVSSYGEVTLSSLTLGFKEKQTKLNNLLIR